VQDGRVKAGWRPPWGFLGMLGLVMAIEWTLSGHDLDFTAPWHWDWRVIGKAATRPDRVKGKELLFFGDSLVKFGLMPKVIQQGSGKTAYNFALHTGQTSSSYFMLRRTLRAGAKPSAVVLDLTPHMFMHNPDVNKNLWAELLSAEECLDLASTMKDPAFFARTMLEKALPTIKERMEIRANLMAALQGKSTSRRFEIPSYRRNWKLNDGAQLMGYIGAPTINPDQWANELYSKWEPDPINVAYLDRFLALASEYKIPVYWLLPPIHPDVQVRTDANRFDLAYSNFVKVTQARFPGTVVVDSRHSGFSPDLFLDGAHVNRRGALKLSAALADVLREPAVVDGSPRWVGLDLSKARDFDGPIEDVNQSVVALRADALAAKRR
jgi:hypothetical protein